MKHNNDMERAFDLGRATGAIRMALIYADMNWSERAVATLRDALKYLDERNEARDKVIFGE